MGRLCAIFLLCALLAGCVPQSGTLVSPQTGLEGAYTRQVLISDHRRYRLMGHLIDVSRDGERVRALMIDQRRDLVNRLTIREAWYEGVALPYQSTQRLLDGCSHGHCLNRAVGMIVLSERYFAYARAHGLRARLTGRAEAIDIHVPAALFNELAALSP